MGEHKHLIVVEKAHYLFRLLNQNLFWGGAGVVVHWNVGNIGNINGEMIP